MRFPPKEAMQARQEFGISHKKLRQDLDGMNDVYGNEGFRPLNMHRMRALCQMVIEKKQTAALRFDANP